MFWTRVIYSLRIQSDLNLDMWSSETSCSYRKEGPIKAQFC